jgi:FixJ family two-component response regulator
VTTVSNGPKVVVSIVDDDQSVREALPDLVREFGFAAEAFASADDFLRSESVHSSHCLILDIAMPRMSGVVLWQALRSRGYAIPVIFITAESDRDLRPRLIHEGATECLFKPFSDVALHDALVAALGSR